MTDDMADKLLQLADYIEKHVEDPQFTMGAWGVGPIDAEHPCGTAACALGWGTVLWPDTFRFDPEFEGPPEEDQLHWMQVADTDGEWIDIEGPVELGEALGVNTRDADYAFFCGQPDVSRQAVAGRIREVVRKTGEPGYYEQ